MIRRASAAALLAALLAAPLAAAVPAAAQQPAPQTAQQQGGGATVTILGLEQAVEALRPRQGQQVGQDRVGLMAALSILAAVGRQEQVSGQAARTYRLEVGPQGNILVNGVDLGPLVRAFEMQAGGGRR
jgi:hypothetical protein